jgi:hypothetical protein
MTYFKNAGHCTRCGEPFITDTSVYMVREEVAWAVYGDTAFTQQETVPVCAGCATVKEQAHAVVSLECQGCRQRMLAYDSFQRIVICSDRCAQRLRRKLRRENREPQTCSICKLSFQPKRSDARFCSNACRQWAYRLRRFTQQRQPDDAA